MVLLAATGETNPNCLAKSGTQLGPTTFQLYTFDGANPGCDFIIPSFTQLVVTTEPRRRMPSISTDAVVDFNIVGGHSVSRQAGPR